MQTAVQTATAEGFANAAAAYIRRGWRVVPLEKPKPGDHRSGKKPACLDWPRLRWSEQDAATHWSRPGVGNLGILTGSASGIVVLDFDSEAVGDGWREAHGDVTTYTVGRSNAPAGRFHAYFSLLDGMVAPRSAHGDGWDLLSDGCQVVAPPSVHYSHGLYAVRCNALPVPWHGVYMPVGGQSTGDQTPNKLASPPKTGVDRIRSALEAIPPDIGYALWIRIGQALHDWDANRGLPLWRDWSARGANYKVGEPEAKWQTFNGDGVRVGTLLEIAKAHGWKPRGRALVDGYGPLPRKLVDSGLVAGMDRGEMAVLFCVAVTMNQGAGQCRLRGETLVEKCGASDRTVRRAVESLRAKGVLSVTATGRASVFRWGVSV